jgi:predicted DNA-binding transcriptional regulator YafY
MLETSARLLRLLSLFQAQRYWSGVELSERLEVTARTLRRDVDKLRSLGYPVNSTSGAAGGYQLGAGTTLPPLLLDDQEAVAVAVGLRTAASGTVSGIEEASVRALAKVQQVLPARLRRRIVALQSFIEPMTYAGPAVNADIVALIAGACRDCEKLRFRYRARDGVASQREVEPHRLVHTGQRWYLAAWDADRNDWRTFRVDRIEQRPVAGRRFTRRKAPDGDFAAYVARSVSTGGYVYQARVIIHAPLAKAAAKIPATAGKLEAIDDDTCLLEMGAFSLDWLSMYLVMSGFAFTVREPPELIEQMRALAERLRQAAG